MAKSNKRPAVDVIAAGALGIALGIVPFNWMWMLALSIALAGCLVDLVYRKWTSGFEWWVRLLFAFLVVAGVTAVMWKPITEKFNEGHSLYASLTNSELRDRVLTFAKDMRTVESDAERAKINAVIASDAQKEPGSKRLEILEDSPRKLELLYRNNYQVQARQYERELLLRLHKPAPDLSNMTPTKFFSGQTALLVGSFAGPSPMSDIADYLEDLARQLP